MYELIIPRTSKGIYKACKDILKYKLHFKELSEIENKVKFYLCYLKTCRIAPIISPDYEYRWINNKIKFSRPNFIVAILKYNNKPIGCIIVNHFETEFFIKAKHRRKGLMSEAWNQLKTVFPLDMRVLNYGHDEISRAFAVKNCIPRSTLEMRRRKPTLQIGDIT